ncbi:Secreted protein OS=Streptomyces glaucescens OX=1907 GN=SGLAU_16645 PE=4 SV=1 [Streptomyces glaucescens]
MLVGAVVCAVALPLAVASAGSVGSRDTVGSADSVRSVRLGDPGRSGDSGRSKGAGGSARPGSSAGSGSSSGTGRSAGSGTGDGLRDHGTSAGAGDAKAPSDPGGDPGSGTRSSPSLLGIGLSTAARCGPELTAPDGIEAQTCVLTQGEENWARAYYRNTTGRALDGVLTLMGPGGRTVQIRCVVGARDEPSSCETPRETGRSPAGYTAVAEFAGRGGEGPLLLRVGSNSGTVTGS